jgi:hypothetical protein
MTVYMAKSSVKTDLESQAWRAMLLNAFLRWESAVIIALTIILAFFVPQPFPGWQWWFWLIGGALAEVALVYTSLTDPEFGRRVVADMLREEYDLNEIHTDKYRGYLQKAFEYRERIEEAITRHRRGVMRDQFQDTARQVDDWIRYIYQIARRLDYYADDDLFHRDLETVPKRIGELQARLERENDARVRAQLEETLQAKEAQYDNLQKLDNDILRAELQLENTLTAMGTIYSQLGRAGAKDVDSGRVRRLREEMADEVNELQDVLDAMDEVYETSAQ